MELVDLSRILFALLAVLALIGLLALAARKAGFLSRAMTLARKRRLATIESLPLDSRRRALILRCDNRDHLIILGPTGETVVAADLPVPLEAAAAPTTIGGAITHLKGAQRAAEAA